MMGIIVVRKKQNYMKLLSWSVLFLWTTLIFILSSQPAIESNGLSLNFTKIFIDAVDQWISLGLEASSSADLVEQINHIIRKLAHGGSYFIMGLLSVNAFKRSVRTENKSYILSALFCILFAISDEIHQLFVPGRSGEIRDVLIDSIGVILAICMCWGVSKLSFRQRYVG
jgi:VanZ family protein